ncbi:MAG: hypothetical protein RL621_1530 [Bacteroidota bacterium]|jgi:GDP-L-fucose synthase
MNYLRDDFFKNKKILITGCAGFVGTHLAKKLLSLGADVTGTIYRHQPKINLEGIKLIQTDLTVNQECQVACKGIDYVFMCAANSSGAAVIEKEPLTHLTPNIVMNAQMLAASYAAGVKKFIFISSNTVYPVTNYAVNEADTNFSFFDKYHIVGWMKLFSEQMCTMYSNHISKPMKTVVVRPGNLYGPYDKFTWKESKVIAALIRRFAEGQNPLEVWGNGKDIKDFLYIEDFIEGLLNVSAKDDLQGPINLASGVPATVIEVIEALKDISGELNLQIKFDESKPSMLPVRLIDVAYAKELIGWSPKYSLKQGLRETYDWYKDFYSNNNPEHKK